MSNWTQLFDEWNKQKANGSERRWLLVQLRKNLSAVSAHLSDTNVLLYFSAFLQKPNPDLYTQMMQEDINPIMNALYQMDYQKNLAVILHTPGGDLSAVEPITKYIHSKFEKVTVIVPTMCMSAGSMFALSCDNIIISRAGQLGPTDPQMLLPGRGFFSVKEIRQQFDEARNAIMEDARAAHVWAPILAAYGPALYTRASNIENYAQTKIREWLKNKGKSEQQIELILKVFHDEPKFHGQRIDYDIMSDGSMGLNVKLLEENQSLQNAVMQSYHLATIWVETSPTIKIVMNHTLKNTWVKN